MYVLVTVDTYGGMLPEVARTAAEDLTACAVSSLRPRLIGLVCQCGVDRAVECCRSAVVEVAEQRDRLLPQFSGLGVVAALAQCGGQVVECDCFVPPVCEVVVY